ncbi:DUF3732 domain-containing protein [Lentzea cavernae]|uniref:DUF3732 domain-containing protein n=1 Tax=Lentzea cavernae TaxID=2020703 RepID=A0ABQ3MBA0_9PSEU|nr:DUF3732 domain-containing protein [Lentzea cavernae]GHH36791.1 hypothetical protein GCM10017774_24330 [Lentzea cavernae]
MTFQIGAIYLYSNKGEVRKLPFKLGSLNVITGASKTGKSSVLHIIDYCLASTSCHIPTGVIRKHVSRVALELHTDQGVAVTSRGLPRDGRKSTTTMHASFRSQDQVAPSLEDLTDNMDLGGARAFLSRLVGIEANITEVGSGTRERFAVNIRHSLHFVFQAQEEIANPSILFHSQGQKFVDQAIKDSLPYFLRTVSPDYLPKRVALRDIEREIRSLSRTINEARSISLVSGRTIALIREAQEANLIDQVDLTTLDQGQAIRYLSQAVESGEGRLIDDEIASEELDSLFARRSELRNQSQQLRAEADNLQRLLGAHSDFDGEAAEQGARLQSIGLLRITRGERQSAESCPVCESELTQPVTTVAELEEHLAEIDSQISDVRENIPAIQNALASNRETRRSVSEQLRLNQVQIDEAISTQERLLLARDRAVQKALVRGRISLYLESATTSVGDMAVSDLLGTLEDRALTLRTELDPEAAAQRLESAVSRISNTMTQLANELGLEHANSPVRLDHRNLTVIVDTESGPRELKEIGSGENWLGYHVVTLLSLHYYFIEHSSPVPGLVVVDQPSQVYFPPDQTPGDVELEDEDRAALSRILVLFHRLATASDGKFQAIVTDHADLRSADWFQDAIVEKWRDGEALVPQAWIAEGE